MPWQNLSKSTVAQANWVTWAKPHPFHGWFVILSARLDTISLCTKFDSSSFSHSWDGAPKIYKVSHYITTRNVLLSEGWDYLIAMINLYTKHGSLYISSLWRYERRWKMQKLGWLGLLGVSLQPQPFNRVHMTSYSTLTETMHLSRPLLSYSQLFV